MNSKTEKFLLEHIRPVTDEDRAKLPMFSFSRLEQYKNCPMSYKLKYVDEKVTNDTSLALELGSLCHYVLEMKGKMLKEGKVDYYVLRKLLDDGLKNANEDNNKPTEEMLGIKALRKKYFEEWGVIDPSSEMNYDQKTDLFWNKIVQTEMEDGSGWVPEAFEKYFEFVFDDRVILHGYIDRIDVMGGMYRVVDYKTSKKVYDQTKLNSSLQFGIYAMAVLLEYGQLPIEYRYRFILLDKFQTALSVGWQQRVIKHLTDLFNYIDHDHKENEFKPDPSPLCHWCNYCKHNPQATVYKNECPYYSLWTPDKKTFKVNREWSPDDPLKNRKLIF